MMVVSRSSPHTSGDNSPVKCNFPCKVNSRGLLGARPCRGGWWRAEWASTNCTATVQPPEGTQSPSLSTTTPFPLYGHEEGEGGARTRPGTGSHRPLVRPGCPPHEVTDCTPNTSPSPWRVDFHMVSPWCLGGGGGWYMVFRRVCT